MNPLCAIQGQLVDVRNVFTDKCVKLTIHVSAERAMEVMTAFGWPTNVSPVPVAIARLDTNRKEAMPSENSSRTPDKTPAPDPDPPVRAQPRKWDEITPAQQAGIRCNEPAFVKFLNEFCRFTPCDGITSTEGAETLVRQYCGVESRRDIRSGEPLAAWQRLEAHYRAWQLAPGVGAA